jgi:DNA-3-methyladenine glycosylase I
MSSNQYRCAWCLGDSEDEHYHDTQWGVPIHDDELWLQFITLEGAQAGLSWRTIVKKIQAYKDSYHQFNITKVANMLDSELEALRENPEIIRNKLKIYSTRNNAQRMLQVQSEFESFDKYIWKFVNNKPIQNNFNNLSEVPASTQISEALSKDLKKRGFKFVGGTICYALMQASGMVNDHEVNCFRHPICSELV